MNIRLAVEFLASHGMILTLVASSICWTFVQSASAAEGYIDRKINKTVYPRTVFIDKAGQVIFTAMHKRDYEDFSEGFALMKNHSNSFIERHGTVVISKDFAYADSFREGFAPAGEWGEVGFIDQRGEFIIAPKFEMVLSFHDGLAPVKVNGKCGFIDKSGKIVIDPFFDTTSHFSEGLAAVNVRGKIGFIDAKGLWRIKPEYDYVAGFSEGLSLVSSHDLKLLGYIDKAGTVVLRLDPARNARGAFLYKQATGGMHMASQKPKYSSGLYGGQYKGGGYCDWPSWSEPDVSSFSEGLAATALDDKFGYIDKTGKFLIQPQFDYALPFSGGRALVVVGEKIGFIDKAGSFVVKPQFVNARSFVEGLACVAVEQHKWGYIDLSGSFVIPPNYYYAHSFSEGMAQVQVGLEP